jgi:hypothetical protein
LLIYTRDVSGKDAEIDIFFSRNSNVGGTEFEILYPVDFLKNELSCVPPGGYRAGETKTSLPST